MTTACWLRRIHAYTQKGSLYLEDNNKVEKTNKN